MEWIRLSRDEAVIVLTESDAKLVLSCIEELVHTKKYMEKPLIDLHKKIRAQVFPDERK